MKVVRMAIIEAKHYASKSSINIYVGNLSLMVTEMQLAEAFTSFGQVLSVRLMNDAYIGSNQPFGYAYVEMAVRAAGEAAIKAMDSRSFNNRAVNLIESLPVTRVKESRGHLKRTRQRS